VAHQQEAAIGILDDAAHAERHRAAQQHAGVECVAEQPARPHARHTPPVFRRALSGAPFSSIATTMFRLAHISDVHLGPLPAIGRRELLSKRITGYMNWRGNRSLRHDATIVARLIADLIARTPDHLAITGDLVNLALDSEIANARLWLEAIGKPENVTIVCGNHDAYVPGALGKALAAWQPWIAGDDGAPVRGDSDFPTLRRRGGISIIGCNSARATMPFMATGHFLAAQARALGNILEEVGRQGRCRVVLIHHPPVRGATAFHKRLVGASLFRHAIAAHGAELVLHGHTHRDTVVTIPGRDGPVPVVGVPAGGQSSGHRYPAARYNLFNIAKGPRGWSIAMQEFGIGAETAPVALVRKRQLA